MKNAPHLSCASVWVSVTETAEEKNLKIACNNFQICGSELKRLLQCCCSGPPTCFCAGISAHSRGPFIAESPGSGATSQVQRWWPNCIELVFQLNTVQTITHWNIWSVIQKVKSCSSEGIQSFNCLNVSLCFHIMIIIIHKTCSCESLPTHAHFCLLNHFNDAIYFEFVCYIQFKLPLKQTEALNLKSLPSTNPFSAFSN